MDDQHRRLWEASWETYYDVYFEALLACELLAIWTLIAQLLDIIAGLAFLTGFVSASVFWENQVAKTLLLTMGIIMTAMLIIRFCLQIPRRIGDLKCSHCAFDSLRLDLESFRQTMDIEHDFPLAKFIEVHKEYRDRYAICARGKPVDILDRRGLQLRVNDKLDARLPPKCGGEQNAKTTSETATQTAS